MTLQQTLRKMLEEESEIIGGYPASLTLGKLIGSFNPMVKIFMHAPEGDIEIELFARDLKVKSYLLTSGGNLYKSLNNRIFEAKRKEEELLYKYILAAYKNEYGRVWRWWL